MRIFIINLKRSVNRAESMKEKVRSLAKTAKIPIYLENKLLNANNLGANYENSRQDSINLHLKMPQNNISGELRFSFLEACDGAKFGDKNNIPKHYSPILARLIRGKYLSHSEIACFSSHFSAWELCVKINEPIIVLEDDICFESGFIENYVRLLGTKLNYVRLLGTKLNYVRLFYLFERKIKNLDDTSNTHFFYSTQNISGTQGYYLTPLGAQNFIKKSKFWFHCVDNYMDMFFINHNWNVIFKPFMISEDKAFGADSTISGRKKIKIPLFFKFTREISRIILFFILRPIFLIFHKPPTC